MVDAMETLKMTSDTNRVSTVSGMNRADSL